MRRYLSCCVVLWACGPGDVVRVVDQVSPDGAFTTRDVELSTLDNVQDVSGEAARFLAGAVIPLESYTLPRDRGRSRDARVESDHAVHANWIMEGEVVVPTDFDSLSMLSAYAHLEEAALHFSGLGVAAAQTPAPVYYAPEFTSLSTRPPPNTDNALFISDLDAFVVLRNRVLDTLPLSMNPGVLAHEYSHRVFYYEFWGAELFALLADTESPAEVIASSTFNLIRAADEGVADFFGAVISGDPGFIRHSLPPQYQLDRRLDVARQLDPAWINGVQPTISGAYDPYPLGSVLASVLWGLAQVVDAAVLEVAVLQGQRAMAGRLRAEGIAYALGDLEAQIIAALPAAHTDAACAAFLGSYAAAASAFSGVCP